MSATDIDIVGVTQTPPVVDIERGHKDDISGQQLAAELGQMNPEMAQHLRKKYRGELGPQLCQLLDDPQVTDFWKNPHNDEIWIKTLSDGKDKSNFKMSDSRARRFIATIASAYNAEISASSPRFQRTIPFHGARFSAVVPPVSPGGAAWTIRKRSSKVYDFEDYKLDGIINDKQIDRIVQLIHERKNILIGGEQGSGKALTTDTPILTPTGWTRMGDIRLGDFVMGRDGKPTRVIGVYPQGQKEAFRVTFTDGTSTICCDEHLWSVQTHNDYVRKKGFRVLPLREIRTSFLTGQGYPHYAIPMVEPLQFPEAELPIDPYLLGALIGDGTLYAKGARFTTADEDMAQEIVSLLPTGTDAIQYRPMHWRFRAHERRMQRSTKTDGRTVVHLAKNPLTIALDALGLSGKRSWETSIPEPYLFASTKQRIGLLQGLFDTDGHAKGTHVEYSTVSERLAHDVVFLVQSIGGVATMRSKRPTYTHDGERKEGRLAYRLVCSIPNGIDVFRLARKLSAMRQRTEYHPTRKIKSIEPVGQREMRCIAVDNAEHLYVVNDCIVTHNSTLANAIIKRMVDLYPTDRFGIIEDTQELQCAADDRFEWLTANSLNGDLANVAMEDLIHDSLRWGANRLCIGEVRAAASALLEAWTAGYQGGVATIHGSSPAEVMRRFEILLRRDNFPVERDAIVAAVHAIVIIRPYRTGRIVREVVEVGLGSSSGYQFTK